MRNIDRYVEGKDYRYEAITPINLQTVFPLAETPVDAATVRFSVNGVSYEPTTNFTVSGATVTWLDTPFTIQATDFVEVEYVVRE